MQKQQPSVIEQLQAVSTTLEGLECYAFNVEGPNDLEDQIFYSKLNDMVKLKIEELQEREANPPCICGEAKEDHKILNKVTGERGGCDKTSCVRYTSYRRSA